MSLLCNAMLSAYYLQSVAFAYLLHCIIWFLAHICSYALDYMWQNHLRNEGSVVQDADRVILDEARMYANTYTKHSKP
jgi:hypothetical protein